MKAKLNFQPFELTIMSALLQAHDFELDKEHTNHNLVVLGNKDLGSHFELSPRTGVVHFHGPRVVFQILMKDFLDNCGISEPKMWTHLDGTSKNHKPWDSILPLEVEALFECFDGKPLLKKALMLVTDNQLSKKVAIHDTQSKALDGLSILLEKTSLGK